MKQSISRRSLLANSAALGIVLGPGATSSMASPLFLDGPGDRTAASRCCDAHTQITHDLISSARTQSPGHGLTSHALKTARCPHCDTQIGYDPSLV